MSDEMVINFMNEASTGFDEYYDTKDWGSYYAEATQIYSMVAGEMLSVNSLPFVYDQMISVPVSVQCAKTDSYNLNFSNLESFDNVDIWLEDLYAKGELIKITPDNNTYTLVGAPHLMSDRFIIHFNASFLPNFIGENETKLINIYAANNNVHIINDSNEDIQEIAVYNIMGQEVTRTRLPAQQNYKLGLSVPTGYYIVRVRTDTKMYSEKVFIFN